MVQAKKAKKEAERAVTAAGDGDTEMADPSNPSAPAGDENPPGDADAAEPTDAELEAVEVRVLLPQLTVS